MRFSYNWLQSFFSKKLPEAEKLAEILTMHSFEVEGVEKDGDDWILDIDILPNRASDCLSHIGVAREIGAVLNVKCQMSPSQTWSNVKSSSKSKIQKTTPDGSLTVTIDGESLCPRYTAYVIDNIKIQESPKWMQKRLLSMEQKPINNIVDLTNYIMWELGQPLHAFDFDKIRGGKMIIRKSKKGEELETLDGEKYSLDGDTIIIEDGGLPSEALAKEGRLIDLAGIKGGANTQIENSTKRIVLQAAIFDPVRIRKTTQTLGARTDAAVRYIHGFDRELPPQALGRAFSLLQEINPEAKVVQKIDIYPVPQKAKQIILDMDYTNRLLGTSLSKREVQQIFNRLNFVSKIFNSKLYVNIPTYRLDINIAEDLIEEIGRIYGYEEIRPEMPRGVMQILRRNERVFWRSMARQFLSGMGFSEVYNYSLVSSNALKGMTGSFIELENPMSDEFRYLRPVLFSGILKNISLNAKRLDSMKLFGLGKVFHQAPMPAGVGIHEEENCIVAVYDAKEGPENFYRIKGYVDEFLKNFGITDFYYDPSFTNEEEKKYSFLHPGRRVNVVLNNEKIGFLGEVHPSILGSYDIKGRVYLAELAFEKIQEVAESEHIYLPASKYPEVVRDIALLVPREVMAVEVLNTINSATAEFDSVSGPLLRDIDLFDMYEGENVPGGMKNFAFHLIFQSDEKTLTSKEVDKIVAKITKTIEEKGWEVR